MTKVRRKRPFSARELYALVKTGGIDLSTEYQREFIWDRKKQGRLIDSMLRDIDIPKIYLARFKDEKTYECIDGKQRLRTIQEFFENKIRVHDDRKYNENYSELKNKSDFKEYVFDVIILVEPSEEYIRDIFKRLQLGTPLNGGEKLNAKMGDMRKFVFDEIGKKGPFICKLGGGYRRFSKESLVAQIVINSSYFRTEWNKKKVKWGRKESEKGEFQRARFEDLEDFFDEYKNMSEKDKKATNNIKETLKRLENLFGKNCEKLDRKAAVVSAYLLVEKKMEGNDQNLDDFPKFYLKLLNKISEQRKLIREYKMPNNTLILEKFHKYLQQASVESYAIKYRQNFLEVAFKYYLENDGKIIDDEKEFTKLALKGIYIKV